MNSIFLIIFMGMLWGTNQRLNELFAFTLLDLILSFDYGRFA